MEHPTGEPDPVAVDPDPDLDPDTLAASDMLKNGDLASKEPSPPIGLSSSWYSPPVTHRSGYGAPVQRYDVPLAPATIIDFSSVQFVCSQAVHRRRSDLLVMFTRYEFPVNSCPLFSITCALMNSGYCCGWTPSQVSDTLAPLVMPSKELVKPASTRPAARTEADANAPSFMAVVSELVAREPGGLAWCLGRGREGGPELSRELPRLATASLSVPPTDIRAAAFRFGKRCTPMPSKFVDYFVTSYPGGDGGLDRQPAANGMFDCCTRREEP